MLSVVAPSDRYPYPNLIRKKNLSTFENTNHDICCGEIFYNTYLLNFEEF